MIALEKWEIRPLTEAQRLQIFSLLGLSEFPFLYGEKKDSQILRLWEFSRGEIHPVVPVEPQHFPKQSTPQLWLEHSSLIAEPSCAAGLAEQLVPFPLRLLADPKRNLHHSDLVWGRWMNEFFEGLRQLEDKILSAEISILVLQQEGLSLCVFFHSVRRRFLQVGSVASVDEPSFLEALSRLGASFQKLHLWVEQQSSLEDQIRFLRSQIERAVAETPLERAYQADLKPGETALPL